MATATRSSAVQWLHFEHADDGRIDELARRFALHPLHVEDVRSAGERVKVEAGPHYTFALLKTLAIPEGADEPVLTKICLFAGQAEQGSQDGSEQGAFFIVVADTQRPEVAAALYRAEAERETASPGRLLYLVFDSIVDSYFPAVDSLDDEIDALEDRVVSPRRDLLSDIFAVKRQLVDMRRLLVSTRDASMHLQRTTSVAGDGKPVDAEHQLYLRDLYDHITRLLDMVETQRDLLNNALDIYLSSIANRTNEVMKVLTILSTVALPALVMTGFYGMNIKGLPFVNSPYAIWFVCGLTLLLTGGLLALLRWMEWI
jgi:magnesium transporter